MRRLALSIATLSLALPLACNGGDSGTDADTEATDTDTDTDTDATTDDPTTGTGTGTDTDTDTDTDTGTTGMTDAPPGELPDGWVDQLGPGMGCRDVHLYASNADNTIAVFVRAGPIVEAAHANGMANQNVMLPQPGISVTVWRGQNLTAAECTDVIDESPMIDARWTATSGNINLDVVPDGAANPPEYPARANVTISGIYLMPEMGAVTEESISQLVWTDVAIGWLPG